MIKMTYFCKNYFKIFFYLLIFFAIAGSGKPFISGYDGRARFYTILHFFEGEHSKLIYDSKNGVLNDPEGFSAIIKSIS